MPWRPAYRRQPPAGPKDRIISADGFTTFARYGANSSRSRSAPTGPNCITCADPDPPGGPSTASSRRSVRNEQATHPRLASRNIAHHRADRRREDEGRSDRRFPTEYLPAENTAPRSSSAQARQALGDATSRPRDLVELRALLHRDGREHRRVAQGRAGTRAALS